MIRLIILTFIGTFFCFIMTSLGSSLVFITNNKRNHITKSLFLGIASGVMFAALIWSLIIPATESETGSLTTNFVLIVIGLILGALLIGLMDFFLPEKSIGNNDKQNRLLFISMTLHNIPEGIAVGLSIAVALLSHSSITLRGAMMLAIGVGIQNFPEGSAISIPFYQHGCSKKRAFTYGMLSGIVEPVFGVLAVFIVKPLLSIMPLILSFAAGSMMYVVIKELIPQSHLDTKIDYGTIGFFVGFIIMMSLDILIK